LTPRQREITALVTEGLTNSDIAERLGLSRQAVSDQVQALLAALGLPNRLSLAAWFLRQQH
jgi:non-specific serine/threonine protein kinase